MTSQCEIRNDGVSLYTMLAAVVVLGVLGSVMVTSFTGTSARARAVVSIADAAAQAANRFHADTGCWPTNVMALVEVDEASRNTCQRPITAAQWNGPYLEKRPVVARKPSNNTGYPVFALPDIGPQTRLLVWVDGGRPAVWVGYLTKGVAARLENTNGLFMQKANYGGPYTVYQRFYSRYSGSQRCCDGQSYDK